MDRILSPSLLAQTNTYEFIPIDNLQEQFKSAAAALNFGGKQATGKYIIFIHQDVELDSPAWLANVERILDTIEDLGIAGVAGMSDIGSTDIMRGRGYVSDRGQIWAYANKVDIPTEVQTLDECVLIIPREVFIRMQFDNETFDYWHCYGVDYCLSVRKLGLKAYVIPAFIYHRCLQTNIDKLLMYQIRLFNKHKKRYHHIYTTSGELTAGILAKWSLYKMLSPLYFWLFPSWINYLKREIQPTDTVLDLGCGYNSPIQYCTTSFRTGVELFPPYLEESRKKAIHTKYINADVSKIEFDPKSFDVVLASEILEHITKEDGYKLINKMAKWAKKKIILTTPNGYLSQGSYDDNLLQEHLSGWNVADLKNLGFHVHGFNGWKVLRKDKDVIKFRPHFIWFRVADISQWIAYWFPETAFQLFAMKNIN